MKVLWITNLELPKIANYFGRETFFGGWLKQSSELLSKSDDVELHICSMAECEYEEIRLEGIYYSAFVEEKCDKTINELIQKIIPDIIHIWGTEYYHSYVAAEAAKKNGVLKNTVVSLQGLISFISQYHYYAYLPEKAIKRYTLSGIKNRTNIEKDCLEMKRMSEYEKKTLKIAENCIGRTRWDRTCVKLLNDDIRYFNCSEIMRESFYKHKWAYENCKRHSVFFSQANYPLKGFHIMLEAAEIIRKYFPDFTIRVTGNGFVDSFDSYIRDDAYRRYLRELVNRFDLWNNISWLGSLDENRMVKEYCSCNVFVCASSIENSSNSVCEAMLLGVPIVASDVGGIRSLLEDGKEGLLYQADAPYLLASKITYIFNNTDLAENLGKKARSRAIADHDPETVTADMMKIYSMILGTDSSKGNKQEINRT